MSSALSVENKKAQSQVEAIMALIRDIPAPAFLSLPDGNVLLSNSALLDYIGMPAPESMEFIKLHQFESLFGTNLHPDAMPDQMNTDNFIPINFSDLQGNLKNGRLKFNSHNLSGQTIWCYIFVDETQMIQMEDRLSKNETELSIFSQVVSSLGSKLSFNEILRTILIAVTAREGLGFNRACLFFYREKENCLKGYLAIGPSSPEEAGRIWGALPDEGKSLREVLRQYTDAYNTYEDVLDKQVRNMIIPYNRGKYLFSEVVFNRKPMIIREKLCSCQDNCEICSLMGVSELAAVPMVARDKVLGVIMADNHITSRSITQRSLAQLQVFANQAAIAIERSSLYDSLAANLAELEKAHLSLRDAQDEIVKIERVSLWSELTNDIAHELRNPSSIIGGFAALMLKSSELPESLREQAEIIYCESKRLDKAIEDMLDFSKSFSQEKGEFDMVDVVREVLTIFELKSTRNLYRIKPDRDKTHTLVDGRRDQVMYAVYTLIYLLEERLKDNCIINIDFESADNNLRMILEISGCESEIKGVLNDFSNPRVGRQGLKLSMALESIRYNGGRLGIESGREGSPRVYMECPLARRYDA